MSSRYNVFKGVVQQKLFPSQLHYCSNDWNNTSISISIDINSNSNTMTDRCDTTKLNETNLHSTTGMLSSTLFIKMSLTKKKKSLDGTLQPWIQRKCRLRQLQKEKQQQENLQNDSSRSWKNVTKTNNPSNLQQWTRMNGSLLLKFWTMFVLFAMLLQIMILPVLMEHLETGYNSNKVFTRKPLITFQKSILKTAATSLGSSSRTTSFTIITSSQRTCFHGDVNLLSVASKRMSSSGTFERQRGRQLKQQQIQTKGVVRKSKISRASSVTGIFYLMSKEDNEGNNRIGGIDRDSFDSGGVINNSRTSSFSQYALKAGESALQQVQWLATRVAAAELPPSESAELVRQERRISDRYGHGTVRTRYGQQRVSGTGGSTFSSNRKQLFHDDMDENENYQYSDEFRYNSVGSSSTSRRLRPLLPLSLPSSNAFKNTSQQNEQQSLQVTGRKKALSASTTANNAKERLVWEALTNLEDDMQLLDRLAGQRPQLSTLEFSLLTSAIAACVSGPLIWGGQLASYIAPSAAAFAAAVGVGAEYTGKVAVADGKEVAAASIQCVAEAESFLANAERAKAVTPLCVGISAAAATLSILVPELIETIASNAAQSALSASSTAAATTGSMTVAAASTIGGSSIALATELYLCCPLVAVLTAAVAGLALEEVKSLSSLAIGVGNRRFARSGLVGRTWLSSTELIDKKSKNTIAKWRSFGLSVLPAPIIGGLLIPGTMATKTVVVAAVAAAQSAYALAQCEYVLGRATDAVALKARSAAVCDTYANQGARSAAILPFTSALSGLCAAATAVVVELPFLEHLAESGTPSSVLLEIMAISALPTLSALFAAAAAVSKARCEVDAEAAMQAASTIALPYNDEKQDPILQPIKGVLELIQLTFNTSIRYPVLRFFRQIQQTTLGAFRLKLNNIRGLFSKQQPKKTIIQT